VVSQLGAGIGGGYWCWSLGAGVGLGVGDGGEELALELGVMLEVVGTWK
jgi:hypothetical protein